nr:MAG TPA: LPS-assembly protein [Caudoviricetes sp.]DAH70478.1 MAG TPA: LPS-assembly protein [Caudoviricetes sp.]
MTGCQYHFRGSSLVIIPTITELLVLRISHTLS